MGRFAPGHYDDVFVSKFKKLISSSLDKSRTPTPESSDDDTAPSSVLSAWTFEKFVAGLDDADPFIAALVDVLVKEVTSRTQNERRGHRAQRAPSYTRPTMTSDTADALRRLLRSSRIGSPIATERIWDAMERTGGPRVRPQSRMAFSSTSVDIVNATRDMRGTMGTDHIMSPPHEIGSETYDPLFDTYYPEATEPFGGSWTSRYGMSPPPPAPVLAPPEVNPTTHIFSLTDPAPLSPGPPRERPPSLADRVTDIRRAPETRSSRSTDFASYSARRRALHRSISRNQLEDRRERDHSPRLWDAEIEFLGGEVGREVNARSFQSDTDPDVEIDFVSSRPAIRALRRPMLRNLSASSPLVPPDSAPPTASGRMSSSHRNHEPPPSASFDDLRHRLEAYPRRGSYGTPIDDSFGRPGSLTGPMRPSHSALLLTQGRSRSRSPVSLSGPRGPPRPLRRQALRAPDISEPPANAELGVPRHSSLPPPSASESLLGPSDDHEVILFSSPSPLPITLTMTEGATASDMVPTSSSEDPRNNGTNEREDSLPPPIIQLMVPRTATPEFA